VAYIDVDSLAQFEFEARTGRPEALYNLGLAYSTGQGVTQDYVAAHKWFNLAAMRGVNEAKGNECRPDRAGTEIGARMAEYL